tara:strand:- start:9 stop:914 length:906 start_codon:yes stop_codon:yes gene_type:complete
MEKKLLNGKIVSEKIYSDLDYKINVLKKSNIVPRIEVILIGNRDDSELYVKMKQKKCEKLNIICSINKFKENVSQDEIIIMINKFNENKCVHGILVQLPLPSHLDTHIILNKIHYLKDVDGFNDINIGKLTSKNNPIFYSCTACGCIEILDFYNINISGKIITIVGCSNVVGLPLSLLLLHRNATPIICHSLTPNLINLTKQADILITACGQTEMIKNDWIKKDCIIIDVGINRKNDPTKKKGYRTVGDVDFDDVKDKVSYITPVPGGVGPMTICILLNNIVKSAFINNNLNFSYKSDNTL